ncbi:MAG: electron transport complex subunit RsxC [Eubacterium sp.]|nr:electron transport complex subunit RsxC [Eubacterium sp.]
MKLKTFKKGVHPYGGKEYAKDCAIAPVEPQDEMVFPLSQNLGAPSKAVVAKGDRVLKGQMIAEAGGFISAPIFSSVSGTVKAIEKRLVVNGSRIDSIVIENDGLDEAVEGFGSKRKLEDLSKDEIIDAVRGAGIVGLGGAGFPTAVKLTPKNADSIDKIIINGAECEPYLTSDYRLMLEKPDEILFGIQAMLKVLPNAQAIIGIEANKPEAIDIMTKVARVDDRVSVCPLKTKYPQGGERQLIYAVTGRKINSKMLPADKGCIVDNVGTVFAIYEAVYENKPLIHNIATVTGEGVNKPGNFDIPLGISHSYLLETAGGAKEDAVKFISGGPMMGIAMESLDVPMIKTSAAILAYCKDEVAEAKETPCIHCGRCVRACPENLIPQLMGRAVKREDIEAFGKLGGMECIECGCCAYGCPAKIPLTQMFKLGKLQLRELNAKK